MWKLEFTGLMARKEFWINQLIITSIALAFFVGMSSILSMEGNPDNILGVMMLIFIGPWIWALVAQLGWSIRRFRDAGVNPWWFVALMAIGAVPVAGAIGSIIAIIIMVLPTKIPGE